MLHLKSTVVFFIIYSFAIIAEHLKVLNERETNMCL